MGVLIGLGVGGVGFAVAVPEVVVNYLSVAVVVAECSGAVWGDAVPVSGW